MAGSRPCLQAGPGDVLPFFFSLSCSRTVAARNRRREEINTAYRFAQGDPCMRPRSPKGKYTFGSKMRPIRKARIWALLALCATAQAAEKPATYHAPRLPDGHADMPGRTPISRRWSGLKNSLNWQSPPQMPQSLRDSIYRAVAGPINPTIPAGLWKIAISSRFAANCAARRSLIRRTGRFPGTTLTKADPPL